MSGQARDGAYRAAVRLGIAATYTSDDRGLSIEGAGAGIAVATPG
jgi:hypothetical protein